MKSFLLIGLSMISLLIIQCNESEQQMSSHTFISSYQPPEFEDADRMAKAKSAMPEIEKLFRQLGEEHNGPGFSYGIVVGQELVLAGGLGVINVESQQATTSKSLFRIASMTKSFTAMAILKLRDEGKLRLSDPVAHYLPELAELVYLTEDAPSVNIQNLMTMSSGFPEDNPWADRQLEDSEEEFSAFLKEGIAFSSTPSLQYEYSNLGFAMLGRIITNVSGMPYQQYITQNILEPLGMIDTKWDFSEVPDDQLALGYIWEEEHWQPEPMLRDGAYGSIGGLITSIEDFGKYVAFLLSATPPRNGAETGPVRRSSVREMQLMHHPQLLTPIADTNENPCTSIRGYGYGLSIIKRCNGEVIIRHSGGLPGFGSNVIFLPDYGIGVFSFSNRRYGATEDINTAIKDHLIERASLEPRKLPVSDVLAQRKDQILELIKNWDETLGDEILAENFYLDWSREYRMKELGKLMEQVGEIIEVEPLIPQNQLRGTFKMIGENGVIAVFFSLSPEYTPKVQMLIFRILEDG